MTPVHTQRLPPTLCSHLVSVSDIVHLLYIYRRVCAPAHCVSLQSRICHTCWWRMETWRWRSTMNTFTDAAISSRPPRRIPAMRGKWVWHHCFESESGTRSNLCKYIEKTHTKKRESVLCCNTDGPRGVILYHCYVSAEFHLRHTNHWDA